MKIKQAIIPAAGLGVKFLPISKVLPKELLPVVDKSCLEIVIEEAVAAGVEDFIIVTSTEKQLIESYFKESAFMSSWLKKRALDERLEALKKLETQYNIQFVYQEEPLGLGHAIHSACTHITDDNFFVLLPDDIVDAEVPVLKQMIGVYEQQQRPTVAVMQIPWDEVCHYGVVQATPLSEQLGDVQTIIEKPSRQEAPSNLAVIGRYLLPKQIFSFIEKTKPGAGGEIQLTDAIRKIIPETGLNSYLFTGERYDAGAPIGLLKASIALSLKHPLYKDEMQKTIKILAAGI